MVKLRIIAGSRQVAQNSPMRTARRLSCLALICFAMMAAMPSTQPVALPPSGDEGMAAKALSASPRHGEWVDISISGSDVKLHTWVVYPERHDKAPIVIVIHEIFGMTDWVRGVTDQLASQGYIAVAPDLLSGFGPNGGGTESLGTNVAASFRKLSLDEQAKRLDAVRDYALSLPSANDRVASIGFCWGGGASFAYAAHQPKLKGAVVFYGTPPSKSAMANIACPILGLYGKDDARVTSTVDATTASMAQLNRSYRSRIFDGAGHGFLRQQSGRNGANQKAADEAWEEVTRFLKSNLEGQE